MIARIITFIKNKIRSFGGQKGKKGKKNTKEDDKREMKKDQGKDEMTDVDRKRHQWFLEEIKQELKKPSKVKTLPYFIEKKEYRLVGLKGYIIKGSKKLRPPSLEGVSYLW